jgi:hypothetical protein
MKDEGHEWQYSRGIALACEERKCTKWMRKEEMVVRNWGREVLRASSVARQSYPSNLWSGQQDLLC